MDSFAGKFAVVTGAGSGLGRELARQIASQGASVALCDLSEQGMQETADLIRSEEALGTARITCHVADVSDEGDLIRFREQAMRAHERDALDLLFNNAGVGGNGSFVCDPREGWERVFNICWNGVYLGCRTFLPMLMASASAHIVNISSVNGFWATVGPTRAHTAYSAAKFAVKGFTEALVTDLRLHAPHVQCSVVMPGHVGTSIFTNSRALLGGVSKDVFTAEYLADARVNMERISGEPITLSDAELQVLLTEQEQQYRNDAPTTAGDAARSIIAGVQAGRWRILVGDDAEAMDRLVREFPEEAYEQSFMDKLLNQVRHLETTLQRG